MQIDQFVMAYKVEQDRLRAMLPNGYESLRPVLRINVEIRKQPPVSLGSNGKETVYIELNTPVEAFGKRGWLNIANWDSTRTDISYKRHGASVTFDCKFLQITYTGVGVKGGCPAEKDNDGCFFIRDNVSFVPVEHIDQNKEFCDCEFRWKFSDGNAHGISVGGKSVPAKPTPPEKHYERQPLSADVAADISCEQILGSYKVCFERKMLI